MNSDLPAFTGCRGVSGNAPIFSNNRTQAKHKNSQLKSQIAKSLSRVNFKKQISKRTYGR